MTNFPIAHTEKRLIEKERKYSKLMRQSFEISLHNRERANKIHAKAKELYLEIIEVRGDLNYV